MMSTVCEVRGSAELFRARSRASFFRFVGEEKTESALRRMLAKLKLEHFNSARRSRLSAGKTNAYFASSSRFCFAQSLSDCTGWSGGPPSVPQAQGPSIFASVMQEQDLVFKQAQT
jgi:hypothetical protein